MEIWWCPTAQPAYAVTVTSVKGTSTYTVLAYSITGVSASPIDSPGISLAVAASTTAMGPTSAASVPGGLILTFMSVGSSVQPTQLAGPWSSVGGIYGFAPSATIYSGYYLNTPSSGTYTPTWTLQASADSTHLSVTFNPDPPTGGYIRSLTIDHTKCGSSDSAFFTVLVSATASYLKSTANGGKVNSPSGYDIGFSSDGAGNSFLNWEMEYYDPVGGTVVAWVLLSNVSHTADTVFYLWYGNAGITTFQGGPVGAAWQANYACVLHMADNAANTTVKDSSGFGNNGTNAANTSGKTTTGQIDGGLTYNGSTDKTTIANSTQFNLTNGVTWSVWMKSSQSVAANYYAIFNRADSLSDFNGFTVLFEQTTAYIAVQVKNGSGQVLNISSSGTAYNDGVEHQIMLVFDSSGNATIYIDGANVASGSPSSSWAFNGQSTLIAQAASFYSTLAATFDEFRIESINRGADWITTRYNNEKNPGTFMAIGVETLIFPPLFSSPMMNANLDALLRM